MEHKSVLLKEAIEGLNIKKDGIYVDLTLGRAGHSQEILKRLDKGRLIAFDQDKTAIDESRTKLEAISSNFTLINDNFENVKKDLEELGVEKVDGILMDLGVSSPQLDDPSRGFSYKEEGPLDMRMNQDSSLTAYQVVNTYSLERLCQIIREYGEDKDAYRIAKAIIKYRESKNIETTTELAEIIKKSKPYEVLSKKGHPAKQTFQAIRMEVNRESSTLAKALEDAPKLLKSGGRLVIIDFMSLDDRMVKLAFNKLSKVEGNRDEYLLPSQIKEPEYRLITKGVLTPSEEEIEENHRSVSAKMRILERK